MPPGELLDQSSFQQWTTLLGTAVGRQVVGQTPPFDDPPSSSSSCHQQVGHAPKPGYSDATPMLQSPAPQGSSCPFLQESALSKPLHPTSPTSGLKRGQVSRGRCGVCNNHETNPHGPAQHLQGLDCIKGDHRSPRWMQRCALLPRHRPQRLPHHPSLCKSPTRALPQQPHWTRPCVICYVKAMGTAESIKCSAY